MRSMTGFGQGSSEGSRIRVSVTLRAVNHRYLDVVMRLKDEFRQIEKPLRDQLAEQLSRGRVEATFEVEHLGDPGSRLLFNRSLLNSLRTAVDELATEGLLSREIHLADLMRLPDAVRVSTENTEDPDWTAQDLEPLSLAAATALEQLVTARAAEGKALHGAIQERVTGLRALHRSMSTRAELLPDQLAASLRERIQQLLDDDVKPDDTRLAQEVATMVDRNDVSEELDRLSSHLDHFESIAGGEASIGKRLDFLSQEIFRELNTIGSKCKDAELVRHVLDGKVLCEQIREQVQNVE